MRIATASATVVAIVLRGRRRAASHPVKDRDSVASVGRAVPAAAVPSDSVRAIVQGRAAAVRVKVRARVRDPDVVLVPAVGESGDAELSQSLVLSS